MKIPVTVNYQGPKAPFALDPVEMYKGGSDLWVLTRQKYQQKNLLNHPNVWHFHILCQQASL